MVNNTELIVALTSLVGFSREDEGSVDMNQLTETLLVSRSGLYFQESHPLVTIGNLHECAPLGLSDEEFGKWLNRKVEGSIKTVFSDISQRKKLDRSFRDFLSDIYLYNGSGSIYNAEVAQGRFVGYQFVLRKEQGIVIRINKIGMQFTGEQPLTLYLWHTSNMAEPVKTIEININQPNRTSWQVPTTALELRFSQSEIDAGGAWFLGYYESDLAGISALNRENFNFTSGGCNCGGAEMDNWKSWSNLVSVQPFCVMPEDLPEDTVLWNVEKMRYYNVGKTWGLNFNISAYCDLTELISRNESVFAKVIQLQFAVDALCEIGYNTRTNRISEKVMQKAIYELDDRPNGGGYGMRSKLAKELKSVTLDFSGLNKVCLPCSESRIRYGSI